MCKFQKMIRILVTKN